MRGWRELKREKQYNTNKERMADFSFSNLNFKEIFDEENNKGSLKKSDFPDSYWTEIETLREIKDKLKTEKDRHSNEYLELKSIKREVNEKISLILNNHIDDIVKIVNTKGFQLNTVKNTENDDESKPIYTVNGIESKLVAKHILKSLHKIYKVKPGNRNQILSQLKMILSDKSPKYLIRTDLKGFYESIPQDKLLKTLDNSGLLFPDTKRIIKHVFQEYNKLENNEEDLGIPRGISFSAYLSEIYMQRIDEEIQNLPGILFYARYVDDIILISINQDYSTNLETIFNEHYLKLNWEKTIKFDLTTTSYNYTFSYLGYLIRIKCDSDNSIDVAFYLTKDKVDNYKQRILTAFKAYTHLSRYKSANAQKKLYNCLYFLTRNSFLGGAKNGVRVGIFWSNKFLTSTKQLVSLDEYLYSCIDNATIFKPYDKLFNYPQGSLYTKKVEDFKTDLKDRFSFVKGFEEIRFHQFTLNDYKEMHRVFNYEEKA